MCQGQRESGHLTIVHAILTLNHPLFKQKMSGRQFICGNLLSIIRPCRIKNKRFFSDFIRQSDNRGHKILIALDFDVLAFIWYVFHASGPRERILLFLTVVAVPGHCSSFIVPNGLREANQDKAIFVNTGLRERTLQCLILYKYRDSCRTVPAY